MYIKSFHSVEMHIFIYISLYEYVFSLKMVFIA